MHIFGGIDIKQKHIFYASALIVYNNNEAF